MAAKVIKKDLNTQGLWQFFLKTMIFYVPLHPKLKKQ